MPAKKKTVKRGGTAGKSGAGQNKSRGSRGGMNADRRGIAGLLLLGVGILAFLCLLVPSRGGILQAMNLFFKGTGGRLCLLLPILMCCGGILLILGGDRIPIGPGRAVSGCLLFMLVETMLQLRDVGGVIGVLTSEGVAANWLRFFLGSFERSSLNLSGGGAIGAILAWPLYKWFDVWGGMFVTSLAIIITLMIMTGVSLGPLGAKASEIADDLRVRFSEWRENRHLIREERAAERLEEKLARRREEEELEEQRRREAEKAAAQPTSVLKRADGKVQQRDRAEKTRTQSMEEHGALSADAQEDMKNAREMEPVLPFDFNGLEGRETDGRTSPFGVQDQTPAQEMTVSAGTEAAQEEDQSARPALDPAGYKNTKLYLHTEDEFGPAGSPPPKVPSHTEEEAIAAFMGQPLPVKEEKMEETQSEADADPYGTDRIPETWEEADSSLKNASEESQEQTGLESVQTETVPSTGEENAAGETDLSEQSESYGSLDAASAPSAETPSRRRRRNRGPAKPEDQPAAPETEERDTNKEPETFRVTVLAPAGDPYAGKAAGFTGAKDRNGTSPAPSVNGPRRLDDTPLIQPKKEEHAAPEVPKYEYIKPPMDLLKESGRSIDPQRTAKDEASGRKLIETLKSFNVGAELKSYTHGPAITRYEIQPAPGVKVSRITSLADDIALNLVSDGVRIEAPVPGKPVVGIEVPNERIEMVRLRDVLDSEPMRRKNLPRPSLSARAFPALP